MITAKDLKALSSSMNVLYAEDEEMLRESMQNTLSKLFDNTFTATNGQEAFELYKNEQIDIVITDINMPIMDGTELIKNIHKHADHEPIIIVLSAHNESRLLTSLINLGINNFINKPLDKEQMIQTLYKACSVIHDRKMVLEYEQKLQAELEAMERKNRILEQKLKQLAHQTNENIQLKTEIKPVQKETKAQEGYFELLMQDDRDELKELASEMESYIALMFQNEKLHENYIGKLAHLYQIYSSTLNSYTEFFEIATRLYEFAAAVPTLEEKFMQDINQTGIYFESLQLTLENFRQNVWEKEAKDPKFYNASLTNDIQCVIDYLEGHEVAENEIEFF